MGGGGGTTTTNPAIRTDIPLQQAFINLGTDNILYHQPYNTFGAGYQLVNRSPLGQVFVPGPNQTLFGNPYTQSGHVPYFGPSVTGPSSQMPAYYNPSAGSKMGGYNPAPLNQLPGGQAYPGSLGMQQFYQRQLSPQNMPPSSSGNAQSQGGA